MKKTSIVTLIFSIAGLIPVIYESAAGHAEFKVIALAVAIAQPLLVMGILAFIFFMFDDTRQYGKAILLSMGIVLLIGFSVCSFVK